MKKEGKLGFEDDIVRLPGQSVDEELSQLIDERAASYIFLTAMSLFIIVITWINWFQPGKTNPYIISILCAGAILFSFLKLRKIWFEAKNLRRGRDGERYVGQMLEKLRAEGHVIFHDVPGSDFNIDHVIIGPKGIYIIETKTWGKNGNGGEIFYDGDMFILNGNVLEKNPIKQAQAAARWLSNFLKDDQTNKMLSVKPIIVMPSWFITPEMTAMFEKEGVLLHNPKNLRQFLITRKVTMKAEDISFTTKILSSYIKSRNAITQ